MANSMINQSVVSDYIWYIIENKNWPRLETKCDKMTVFPCKRSNVIKQRKILQKPQAAMPVNYDDRNAVTYGSPCGYNTCGLCQQLWKCQGLLQTKRLKHYFLKYTQNAKLLNETSKSLCNSVIYHFRFDDVISVASSFLSSLLEEISDYITLKSRKEQMILLIYNLSFQSLPPLYFRNARHKMNIMQRQLLLTLSLNFKLRSSVWEITTKTTAGSSRTII